MNLNDATPQATPQIDPTTHGYDVAFTRTAGELVDAEAGFRIQSIDGEPLGTEGLLVEAIRQIEYTEFDLTVVEFVVWFGEHMGMIEVDPQRLVTAIYR